VALLTGVHSNELAGCLEKSFKSIDMASAARLLLLTPEQASSLAKFAEQVYQTNLDLSKYFIAWMAYQEWE
jgi:hypothetical protein